MRGRKKSGGHIYRDLLLLQFLLQIAVVCYIIYAIYGEHFWAFVGEVQKLHGEAHALVEGTSRESFEVGEPSIAYTEDGTVVSIWRDKGDARYVPLSAMPQIVIDAMVCTEDKNFYSHHGVDYKALLRAFLMLLGNHGKVTQGGSTITMQLARTRYLTPEVSWQRKLEEVFIAQKLEQKFTKDQIMEYYLNHIYFGNGYYGIGTAGRGYFNKELSELSMGELIFLCAIPNNPSLYNPLKHSDNTEKRKQRILDQMLEDGYLTREEYETAAADIITVTEPEPIERNDYAETYITYCAVRALMETSGFQFRYAFESNEERDRYEKEYAECYADCQELLDTEGYRIETSLDLEIQRLLQDSVDKRLSGYLETNKDGVYEFQGAAVCIDNETGFVKAIVGGRSQEFDFYTLNRGYQSFRQPGSSIKPLIIYTPAFERGYTPDMTVIDEPIAGGPRNATGTYAGRVTVRRAVEESLNTVAWNIFEELTPETGLSYLEKMEFSQIVREDYGLPSSLGGFTVGVSPAEMAAAFAAIENGGVFRSPTCIKRITDAAGNLVYESERSGKRVYTEEAAETMGEVLAGVLERGTGKEVKLEGIPCAGKTGTTNEYKDSWFVGYTDRYTTSVWVGYDMPREIAGMRGAAFSGEIWKSFMEALHGQPSGPEGGPEGASEPQN